MHQEHHGSNLPGQPAAAPVMIFNLIPSGSSLDTVTALILIRFAWW
jgi:hypothetical protein